MPVETLLGIFQLFGPPRTQEDMYTLSGLTHVCQFWRTALINKPQAWATVFVTQDGRRSFVQMWLERSLLVPLEITVDISEHGKPHPLCACEVYQYEILLPNKPNPCEWHFVFEILAEIKYWKRIHTLNILFDGECFHYRDPEKRQLVFWGCQLFTSTPLQLTSLGWKSRGLSYVGSTLPTPLFSPTLRSLSFRGIWDGRLMRVNNLAVLKLEGCIGGISAEVFCTLMLNNRSLQTLSFELVLK